MHSLPPWRWHRDQKRADPAPVQVHGVLHAGPPARPRPPRLPQVHGVLHCSLSPCGEGRGEGAVLHNRCMGFCMRFRQHDRKRSPARSPPTPRPVQVHGLLPCPPRHRPRRRPSPPQSPTATAPTLPPPRAASRDPAPATALCRAAKAAAATAPAAPAAPGATRTPVANDPGRAARRKARRHAAPPSGRSAFAPKPPARSHHGWSVPRAAAPSPPRCAARCCARHASGSATCPGSPARGTGNRRGCARCSAAPARGRGCRGA